MSSTELNLQYNVLKQELADLQSALSTYQTLYEQYMFVKKYIKIGEEPLIIERKDINGNVVESNASLVTAYNNRTALFNSIYSVLGIPKDNIIEVMLSSEEGIESKLNSLIGNQNVLIRTKQIELDNVKQSIIDQLLLENQIVL